MEMYWYWQCTGTCLGCFELCSRTVPDRCQGGNKALFNALLGMTHSASARASAVRVMAIDVNHDIDEAQQSRPVQNAEIHTNNQILVLYLVPNTRKVQVQVQAQAQAQIRMPGLVAVEGAQVRGRGRCEAGYLDAP
jgi:hypothetical protein